MKRVPLSGSEVGQTWDTTFKSGTYCAPLASWAYHAQLGVWLAIVLDIPVDPDIELLGELSARLIQVWQLQDPLSPRRRASFTFHVQPPP